MKSAVLSEPTLALGHVRMFGGGGDLVDHSGHTYEASQLCHLAHRLIEFAFFVDGLI